jgi:glycosyltransferase involved in cell wall biosynthesis
LNSVLILGTRGIPAMHGGFETFAEQLALFLVKRGWHVTVYCQIDGKGDISQESWHGIDLVKIPVSVPGAAGTMLFDLISTLDSLKRPGLPLVLGYNTAILGALFRLTGRAQVINMDGIEWKRAKWGKLAKAWFYLNERLGCWIGNHLIADHPEIARHLSTRVSPQKITMIPYGAYRVTTGDESILADLQLQKRQYSLVVARAEPENSILEIVTAFCRADVRDHKLVVLGNYEPSTNTYHRKVLDAANGSVVFPKAIYDKEKVAALRLNCSIYFHGHTVGGTNPALVEALGAGCAVVAHDNAFNRWVAGKDSAFFTTSEQCESTIRRLLSDKTALSAMRQSSLSRYTETFEWDHVLAQYEKLLAQYAPGPDPTYSRR